MKSFTESPSLAPRGVRVNLYNNRHHPSFTAVDPRYQPLAVLSLPVLADCCDRIFRFLSSSSEHEGVRLLTLRLCGQLAPDTSPPPYLLGLLGERGNPLTVGSFRSSC